MPIAAAVPFILAGTGAAAGALAGSKGARTSTVNQNYNATNTTTPIEDPAYAGLKDLLIGNATSRLKNGVDLSGYEATGLSNIGKSYDAAGTRLGNSLTARGLSTSPIAGAATANLETGRSGEMATFLNSLPMLQRQMEMEDLGLASSIYGQRSVGSTSTGSGSSGGVSVGAGSPWAGAFGGLGTMLGWMAGQGMIGGNKTTTV